MGNSFTFKNAIFASLIILLPISLMAQNDFNQSKNLKGFSANNHSNIYFNLTENINQKYQIANINHNPVSIIHPKKKNFLSNIMDLNVKELQTNTDVLDSVKYIKDGTKYKESYSYDSKERLLTKLNQYWYETALVWANSSRETYTYDENGNRLTFLQETWDTNAGQWVNTTRKTYTYDVNGNHISTLTQLWDTNVGQWGNSKRGTYTYDSDGNQLTFLQETWDTNVGQWVVYQQVTHTYDVNGNHISYLDQSWDTNAGQWVNYRRGTYTYDSDGNELTLLQETWDSIAGQWVDYRQVTHTYDVNGNHISNFIQLWDTNAGQWVNSTRGTFTYDSNGNELTFLYETWDTNAGQWVNSSRKTNTYDGSGKLTYILNESWNGSIWSVSDGSLRFYINSIYYYYYGSELWTYYGTATVINTFENNLLKNFSLSQNYPNPFNPSTVIRFTLPVASHVKLRVFDTAGREIKTLLNQSLPAGKHQIEFNAGNLSSGIYFYRLEAGTFVSTGKMALMK